MADEPFEGAHGLLLGALKVSPPESHPASPFHGGGPALVIDAEAYVRSALWLAKRIAPHVDPRDGEEFAAWVALAERQLAVGPKDTSKQREVYAVDAGKVTRIPAKVGAWAAHEAGNWAWRSRYAGGAARPSAANVARFYAKKLPSELAPYLKELDALCVVLDAETAMRDRKHATKSKVANVLWRAHEAGKVLFWLLRLEDGDLALFHKEKTRWRLVEGARDDVLATVPEAHFAAAVNAALGSTLTGPRA